MPPAAQRAPRQPPARRAWVRLAARWASAWLLAAAAGPVRAEMPTLPELESAVQQLAPAARAAGLRLELGPLWLTALQLRSPLVAGLAADGRCLLGYTAYTPGRDYRWLFPDLPAPARAAWLRGAVAHELVHCVAQARSAAAQVAEAGRGAAVALADQPAATAEEEALADLAFAQQLGADTAAVQALARLRRAHAVHDPAHDSAWALDCWAGGPAAAAPAGDRWFDALQTRLRRCQR